MTPHKFLSSSDLLTELLLHLPSKSAARFRCVSKQFLSILTHPTFLHLHVIKLHPPPTAIFLFRRASIRYTYLDLISLSPLHSPKLNPILDNLTQFHKHGSEILGIHSSKGLMCIHTHINSNNNSENLSVGINNRIYAYDPWSFKSKLIPMLNTKEKLYNVVGVYIVFEPLCEDYKIVCAWERVIVNDGGEGFGVLNDVVMFSFYSSKRGDWSDSRAVLVVMRGEIEFRQGVVWKGNVHWFGWKPKLVCLDVGKECFRTMPEPRGFCLMKFWYFGESGGKLYLVGNRNDMAGLDVLVLEDYDDEWIVKHRVDLSSFLGTKWFRGGVGNGRDGRLDQLQKYCLMGFNVLSFVVNCVDGSDKLLISVGDKLLLYDIRGMEVEEIAEINPLKSSMVKQDIFEFKWFEAYQLIKTHVSL